MFNILTAPKLRNSNWVKTEKGKLTHNFHKVKSWFKKKIGNINDHNALTFSNYKMEEES